MFTPEETQDLLDNPITVEECLRAAYRIETEDHGVCITAFVYVPTDEGCVYYKDGRVCIVGAALWLRGIRTDAWSEHKNAVGWPGTCPTKTMAQVNMMREVRELQSEHDASINSDVRRMKLRERIGLEPA